MTPNARKCQPVVSSWVWQAILMCDDSLALQFKHGVHHHHKVPYGGVPGVVCWYPGTPESYFDMICVWGEPGKFVHQLLYKKWPYQIIANPCPAQGCGGQSVGCCPGVSVPNDLWVTLSGVACLEGSYPLPYVADAGDWTGEAFLCNRNTYFNLTCTGKNWYFGGSFWSSGDPPDIAQCHPFYLYWASRPILSTYGAAL